MSYAQVDTTAARSLKLARVSADARWLYIQGLCYVQDHKTDGFVPAEIVPIIGLPVPRQEWVAELVTGRLWHNVRDGYQIHDYLKWNRSAADREQKQADNRRRVERFRERERADRTIEIGPSQRRLAEPEVPESGRLEMPADQGHTIPPPAPVPTPVPVVTRPRPEPLIMSPLAFAALESKHGYVGPRLRIPKQFHQDLIGRYGGDEGEAERVLQAWYRQLETRLGPDEAIPSIYPFINGHFASLVASRAAAVPVVPVAKRADDQRQGVTAEFRSQLDAANQRRVKE